MSNPHYPTKNILLIEPDPPTLLLYQRHLARFFHVIPSIQQQEIFEILNNHTIAVIVMEPEGLSRWGWGCLEQIRKDPDYSKIPTLVCSVLDDHKKVNDPKITYLVKPVYPDQLIFTTHQIFAAAEGG